MHTWSDILAVACLVVQSVPALRCYWPAGPVQRMFLSSRPVIRGLLSAGLIPIQLWAHSCG